MVKVTLPDESGHPGHPAHGAPDGGHPVVVGAEGAAPLLALLGAAEPAAAGLAAAAAQIGRRWLAHFVVFQSQPFFSKEQISSPRLQVE